MIDIKAQILTALTNSLKSSLDHNDLDTQYNLLTPAEKQQIIYSLMSGDDAAKNLIDAKITGELSAVSQSIYDAQTPETIAFTTRILTHL